MATHLDADRPRRNDGRRLAWGAAASLYLIAVLAKGLSAQMRWDATDFIVFGAMLLGACLAFEIALRAADRTAYRLAAGIAIGAGFLLVWINLAVGVIGSEGNPANLLFAAVLTIGLAGSAAVRLRPAGMMRVLTLMAAAQGAIGLYALFAGSTEGVVLCIVYTVAWLISARLFRAAAESA